jgi:hypothetical protein
LAKDRGMLADPTINSAAPADPPASIDTATNGTSALRKQFFIVPSSPKAANGNDNHIGGTHARHYRRHELFDGCA